MKCFIQKAGTGDHGQRGLRTLRYKTGQLSCVFFITLLTVQLACGADFYVATNGSDSNPGTIDRPFATLRKARDAARALGTGVARNIMIRGGHYYNTALRLQRETGADDSGVKIMGYGNEKAVLYGGMPLTNWVSISNGWWAAALPDFPTSAVAETSAFTYWQVRMLLVDGVMAERAQYPTKAYSLYYSDTSGTTTLHYNGTDLGSWLVPMNAEFQIDYSWDQQTVGASAIDTANKAVTLSPALRGDRGLGYTGVKSYRVYNIAQGMSRPGQFYFDRANGNVVYWPRNGKDPNTSECIVPTTTRVFHIKGRQYSRPWGITFSNLTIQVSSVDIRNEGNFGYLWNEMGLINAIYCDDLVFDHLTLGCTAGNAIGMEYYWNTNTVLKNSIIEYCGASGAAIRAGPCIISNNLFRMTGLINVQAPAVRVSLNALVTRNDFFDIPLQAIGDHSMVNCTISQNHISNAVQVLRDMGAFYTIYGLSNVVTSNFWEHIGLGIQGNGSDARDWFRSVVYFDGTTYNSTVSYNVTMDSKIPFFSSNEATNNLVLNNVFINTNGEHMRIYTSKSSYPPNIAVKNVILSSTNILVDNPTRWASWSSNVFWSTHSPPLTANVPAPATIANPLFVDMANRKLGYRNGSPALAFGITALDTSQMGRATGAPSAIRNLAVTLMPGL